MDMFQLVLPAHREPRGTYILRIIEFLGYSPFPEGGTPGERLKKYRLEQSFFKVNSQLRSG